VLKKKSWSITLGIVVAIGAVSFFGKPNVGVVRAQGHDGQALPGPGAEAYTSPAIEIIAANLPAITRAGGGPVRTHHAHNTMPDQH
jgi:hypothetical protein